MNLFYLDRDLDKCAEAHIDKHVGKMQLEAAQLLTTALWVDKYLGFVPDKLNSDQLAIIKEAKRGEPAIEERTFTRYLPTHENHPCAIWVRSSYDHFCWTVSYVNALNDECMWRGYKSHASCAEVNRMPDPVNLPDLGWTDPPLAMPDKYKTDDVVESYRKYYIGDKAEIATWKRREPPTWWWRNPDSSRKNYADAVGLRDRANSPESKKIWDNQANEIIRIGKDDTPPWK